MAIRTALLTNMPPPYRIKLLRALERHVVDLKIFISTQMENDRSLTGDDGALNLAQQQKRTFFRRCFPHLLAHIPYDVISQLRRYSPRVVISGEFGLRTLQAAIYRVFSPRIRLIVWATLSERTERGWGLTRQVLHRTILRIADAVICDGPSDARYIASFNFPPARTIVVNPPADVELFTGIPLTRSPERARQLLFSGRLVSFKGVLELQEAMSNWAANNPARQLEMIWLGDGDLRGRLERMAVPSNFKQYFFGNQPYDALPDIYRRCGALVLPSLMDEGEGGINEAMASGLIVLGSEYSQAAVEMVREGETGWMIDPLRPDTIRHALDKLFDTPFEKLGAMRAAARKRALLITPETVAEQIYAAIQMVTQNAFTERVALDIGATGHKSDAGPLNRRAGASLDIAQ